jgi:hypothetical protein
MLNPSTRGRFALKGEHHAPEFIPRIAAKFSGSSTVRPPQYRRLA